MDGDQYVLDGSDHSPEVLEAEAGQVGDDDTASNLHMIITSGDHFKDDRPDGGASKFSTWCW